MSLVEKKTMNGDLNARLTTGGFRSTRWCRPDYFKDWFSPAVRGGHTLSFCVAARTR